MTTFAAVSVLRSPHSAYLLGTSLLGRLPGAMAALAIVQLVQASGGNFGFAGLVSAVYIVAGAVSQPMLGRLTDRRGQFVVLVSSSVASFGALVGMGAMVSVSPVLTVILAAVAGGLMPPLEPALRALWPRLVGSGAPLRAAYALDAGAQEIIYIAGPLLTVFGIASFGALGNILFAGSIGLAGALAFAMSRVPRATKATTRHAGRRQRSPLRIGGFPRLLGFTFGIGVPVGALTITATAAEATREEPGLAGWVLAINAVGALTGALLIAFRPLPRATARTLTVCGLLLALGYLPMTATSLPSWTYALVAGIAGLMLPPTLGQIFERTSQLSPAAVLTEANGWIISAMTLGVGLGTLFAGHMVGAAGPPAIPIIIFVPSAFTATLSLLVFAKRRDRLGSAP